jgi:hypothetical protein
MQKKTQQTKKTNTLAPSVEIPHTDLEEQTKANKPLTENK